MVASLISHSNFKLQGNDAAAVTVAMAVMAAAAAAIMI